MTVKHVYNKELGYCQNVIRNDAVKHQDRYLVPTTEDMKWVSTMDEFRAAGGEVCFNEDQTEIELLLPEGYKFSIQMFRGRSTKPENIVCQEPIVGTQNSCTREAGHDGEHRCSAYDVDARKSA